MQKLDIYFKFTQILDFNATLDAIVSIVSFEKRGKNMISSISLLNNNFSINKNFRCTDYVLIDFINNLQLNRPPENTITSSKGTFQELEQYLASYFPKYTFGFKLNKEAQPSIAFINKDWKIEENYVYFNLDNGTLRQPNMFLLVISESKSLIKEIIGKQSFLILKCIESSGKVKLVEIKDCYL